MPVSVLDLVPVGEGRSTTDATRDALAQLRQADRLGFTRYWVAEHHSMPGIASSSPPVLISALAAAGERIRVGSGGVMLPNHPPLVVAEQFGTLASLYPGRIDLGLGRAPGTDGYTARALRRVADPTAEDFPQQLAELRAFLTGRWPEGHPYAGRIVAVPQAEQPPQIWLLGSSLFSAELAGLLGLPFAFAHHFSAAATLPALARYRSAFRPGVLDRPYAMLTVQVLCADTDDDAERLALPSALSFLRLRQGRPGPLPSVRAAREHPWTEAERAFVEQRREGQAVGSPQTVAKVLGELLQATRADELMITASTHDPADRAYSTELVAGLFEALPAGLA